MRKLKLSDFGHITSAKVVVSSKILDEPIPSIEEVKALARWTPEMLELFNVTREQAMSVDEQGTKLFDRSSGMARMAYYGAEQGWTDPQIMAALLDIDNRWEKYTLRRDREDRFIIPLIDRARKKHGYSGSLTDLAMSALLQQQKPVDGSEAAK